MIRGVIFDLDGTLIHSRLDFEAMRREMNLPHGTPILEALESMDVARAAFCQRILDRHEQHGAAQATPIDGAIEFSRWLAQANLPQAVVTRNSRAAAQTMLRDWPVRFDPIICREDGPVKPDPWAIVEISRGWSVSPGEVMVIGDFHFDIEAGRRAGAVTVLFAQGRNRDELPGADRADYILDSFHLANELLGDLFAAAG